MGLVGEQQNMSVALDALYARGARIGTANAAGGTEVGAFYWIVPTPDVDHSRREEQGSFLV